VLEFYLFVEVNHDAASPLLACRPIAGRVARCIVQLFVRLVPWDTNSRTLPSPGLSATLSRKRERGEINNPRRCLLRLPICISLPFTGERPRERGSGA